MKYGDGRSEIKPAESDVLRSLEDPYLFRKYTEKRSNIDRVSEKINIAKRNRKYG